jgi:hypothetical protein
MLAQTSLPFMPGEISSPILGPSQCFPVFRVTPVFPEPSLGTEATGLSYSQVRFLQNLSTLSTLYANFSTMTSRQLSVTRGRNGTVKRFSRVRVPVPATTRLLLNTLEADINNRLRDQILSDPTYVYQFACHWGDNVGYLTRPMVSQDETTGNAQVTGSFSDTIGQCYPVTVSLDTFQGHFTTLVRRGDAEALSLSIHPTSPDTIEGPAPAEARETRGSSTSARRVEATLDRLHFPIPDESTDADRPVIVALPLFLPIAPGVSFDHAMALGTLAHHDTEDDSRLFHTWRFGLRYVIDHNNGLSVTKGGPLFYLPQLRVGDDNTESFETFTVLGTVVSEPTILPPLHALFRSVSERIDEFSESIWAELGGNLPPEPAPAPAGGGFAGGFTPESFRAAVEPLVSKDKTYRLAPRTRAKYRILLSSRPSAEAADQSNAVLGTLLGSFTEYLSEPNNATAADDLKELMRNKLARSNRSTVCFEKDATLEADCVTLAYSDRLRACMWLVERLHATSKAGGQTHLGLLQHLTPDRSALSVVNEGDAQVKSMILANASHSQTQIDASKSSKMYCGGRLSTFRDAYIMVCNLRVLMGLMVDDLSTPMCIQRVMEYTNLLTDRQGRILFDAHHRDYPNLAIHAFQDIQLIWSAFLTVATDSELYRSVQDGGAVALANFDTAHAVADGVISELRAILNGNGIGKFQGTPCSLTWFAGATMEPPTTPPKAARPAPSGAAPTSAPKKRRLEPAEVERKKGLGILTFDAQAAGTDRLPSLTVYHKSRGARSPERLCMPFLTKGHCCNKMERGEVCKLAHVSSVDVLSTAERTKMVAQVRSKPGLTWVEGRAPSGTN